MVRVFAQGPRGRKSRLFQQSSHMHAFNEPGCAPEESDMTLALVRGAITERVTR